MVSHDTKLIRTRNRNRTDIAWLSTRHGTADNANMTVSRLISTPLHTRIREGNEQIKNIKRVMGGMFLRYMVEGR